MKFTRKLIASVLAAALLGSILLPFQAYAVEDTAATSEERYNMAIESDSWENWPAGPQVYAEAAIIMEASTGAILYSKNIDEQLYPASITKIMTVLLALENCELDEEVTFSHYAVYSVEAGSSSIARDEGEILTVEECLYAIMLESANECANAIAEHISGSIEAFAEPMNERAAELGCTNTHFTNANGLPDDDYYTSAHDMALITQAAVKYEKFRQISGTARYTLRATNKKDEELVMSNHHYMISSNVTSKYLDDTVFAGKTGYTTVALNTLVTCATRNGMDLIVVTMKTQGTGERGVPTVSDTATLLDYAEENFQKINISQNETNFTIGQNDLFDTGSSIFGNTGSMIEMDTEGYVVLPVGVELSEATSQLEFVDDEDSDIIAVLSYTYSGQRVGSTTLTLSDGDLQEFSFQKTDGEATDGSTEEEESTPRLIRIDLNIFAAVAGCLLLLILIILLIRYILKFYSVDIHFIRNWRQKREAKHSFANTNRKRYRSRKRRKHDKSDTLHF